MCDAEAACSPSDAPVSIVVHSALRARPSESVANEEDPVTIQLSGADLRGGRLSFYVSRLPKMGNLFECTPPPVAPPALPPAPPPSPVRPPTYHAFVAAGSSEATAAVGLAGWARSVLPGGAMPPAALPRLATRLQPGAAVTPTCGLLQLHRRWMLVGERQRRRQRRRPVVFRGGAGVGRVGGRVALGAGQGPAAAAAARRDIAGWAADSLTFYIVDVNGHKSEEATHSVWVRNVNDAPRWQGVHSLSVEALNRVGLPSIDLFEPDLDVVPWEVQLQAEHGFLSFSPRTLDGLSFTLGDGTSDRLLRFSGLPSAVCSRCATLATAPSRSATTRSESWWRTPGSGSRERGPGKRARNAE